MDREEVIARMREYSDQPRNRGQKRWFSFIEDGDKPTLAYHHYIDDAVIEISRVVYDEQKGKNDFVLEVQLPMEFSEDDSLMTIRVRSLSKATELHRRVMETTGLFQFYSSMHENARRKRRSRRSDVNTSTSPRTVDTDSIRVVPDGRSGYLAMSESVPFIIGRGRSEEMARLDYITRVQSAGSVGVVSEDSIAGDNPDDAFFDFIEPPTRTTAGSLYDTSVSSRDLNNIWGTAAQTVGNSYRELERISRRTRQ